MGRPKINNEETKRIVDHFIPDAPSLLLIGIRGYYLDSIGKPDQNDLNVYDDAMIVFAQGKLVKAYNANTDPSKINSNLAMLPTGTYQFYKGRHKNRINALRAFPEGVKWVCVRQGKNGKWYSDLCSHINIHDGGKNDTWSAGCQTLPNYTGNRQFNDFRDRVYSLMDALLLKTVTYLLLEEHQVRDILSGKPADKKPQPPEPPARMTLSPAGFEFVKASEGERLDVYKDTAGYLTVGIGHLILPSDNLKFGARITAKQSREFFEKDKERFEVALNAQVKVPISQGQFDALFSLAFNIGTSAFRDSTCLRELNAGNYARAADAILMWNKETVDGKKVVNRGLASRRQREKDLFLNSSTAPPDKIVKAENQTPPPEPPDTVETDPPAEVAPTDAGGDSDGLSVGGLVEKAKEIGGGLQGAEDKLHKVSKSSVWKTAGNAVMGWLVVAFGILKDNWEIVLIGAIVIVAIIVYFHFSKQRAHERASLLIKNGG